MWINKPGRLNDSIEFLGAQTNCMYLLKGDDAMIIGGGMSWVVPDLEQQLSRIDFPAEKIKYIVILHSHFDHCGAVPYIKRKYPDIRIIASNHAKEVLAKEKVINMIEAANKEMIDKNNLQKEYQDLNLKIDAINVDYTVEDNDIINLGKGIEVQFMLIPGHSKCAIATYVPSLKAIFPTDGTPIIIDSIENLSQPSPQYDFGLYLKSQKRLADCETELCAFEHNGVVTGKEASQVLKNGTLKTEKYKDLVIGFYNKNHDLEKTASDIMSYDNQIIQQIDIINKDLLRAVIKYEIMSVLRYANISF